MGTVPMAISVEKLLNHPFSGTELDVPRLATPRGRARGPLASGARCFGPHGFRPFAGTRLSQGSQGVAWTSDRPGIRAQNLRTIHGPTKSRYAAPQSVCELGEGL